MGIRKSKSAVVTGATGFVGSHLVKKLIKQNWDVSVLVRPSSVTETVATSPDINIIIDDGESLVEAITQLNPDVCFHLATKFLGTHKPTDINDLVDANIKFGTRVAEAMSYLDNANIVNASTIWQHYGNRPYGPTSLYSATKQAFEDIVQYYAECTPLKAVNVELTDSYGLNDNRPKILYALIDAAKENKTLKMSPGGQIFDILHIDDVTDALIHAEEFADDTAITYGIHSTNPLKLTEFVALVSKLMKMSIEVEWGAFPYRSREMMVPWRVVDDLPGWEQKVPLVEGLISLLSDYDY